MGSSGLGEMLLQWYGCTQAEGLGATVFHVILSNIPLNNIKIHVIALNVLGRSL